MKKPSLQQLLRKAQKRLSAGDPIGARKLYESILEHYPSNQAAERALGALSKKISEPDLSIIRLLEDEYAGQHFDSLELKLASYLEVFPQSYQLWNIQGAVLKERNVLQGAGDAFRRVTELRPDYPDGHNNLGVVLQEQGDSSGAIRCFKTAIQLAPDYIDAHVNLGVPLTKLGEYQAALDHFDRVLKLYPRHAKALNNKASLYLKAGNYLQAIELLTAALQDHPSYQDALVNLGIALKSLGRYEESLATFLRLVDLGNPNPTILCHAMHVSRMMCDWNIEFCADEILLSLGIDTPSVSPWPMLAIEDDAVRQRLRSERYAIERYLDQRAPLNQTTTAKTGRIRVGYFSNDFYSHATLFLIAGLLREHDREHFDVFLFSYGSKSDQYQARLQSQSHTFFDVSRQSNVSICALAKSVSLDIAIDLKGYTEGTRSELFAYGLAPVQVSYLGYPGTMGAPWIQYCVADKIVVPDAQRAGFTEKLIYLPHCYQPNDNMREFPAQRLDRSDYGLPQDAFVLCCFNSPYKISSVEFEIWMRVLREVDDAVLWLYASNPWVVANLHAAARAHGVNSERLIFAKKAENAEHLARHQLADLFVDTFNVNAHTTASDALWVGLPLVTLCGQQFSARVAASVLTAIGLEELITYDLAGYEQLILDLASDRVRLAGMRETLIKNRATSPLFDTSRYTKEFENALLEITRRARAGEQPSDLYVDAIES